MNISKIFELTDEDKAKYQIIIDKIDLSKSSEVINTLNSKLDSLIDSKILNSIETDLIKNVSVLLNIYQTYPDLTDSIRKRIIFAISYFCDSNDDIPDIVPQIGYLDDAVVAKWVVDSVGKDLPSVSLA
ncbi:MAG: YkvA family protein [Candidatus Neomarinimicrobiota bacterium]